MEKYFHAFTIYQLSILAGSTDTDAQTLSYASRLVDNATKSVQRCHILNCELLHLLCNY